MPKNVIILGMARSGTSLSASIFASQGFYVDQEDQIAEKNHMNPTGYWESNSLLSMNENILRASGFDHDNTWIYTPITREQAEFVYDYKLGEEHADFVRGFETHSPWVWKDPRLCYTLGCWWPLLDPDNTAVLLIRRNRDAIYNSFVRVGWRKKSQQAREATYDRIQQHIDSAESLIRKFSIPAVSLNYEDFKKAPEKILDEINEACGLQLSIDDLGYDDRYNHDKVSGKLGTLIDRLASTLPRGWLKFIKRLVPRFILTRLYPERYN